MKIITSVLVYFISTTVIACPDILGRWNSSSELSRTFNDKHALIEERTKEFRSQLIGKSSVIYKEGVMSVEMESIKAIEINGKKYPWDSSTMSIPYEILGCTENVLVLKLNIKGVDLINKLNFENENEYWVYEGVPNGTGNDHTREYFVRARDN